MTDFNDFNKSKIFLFYTDDMQLVDGSIQEPLKRLYTLKNYYKKRRHAILVEFLKRCKVKLLELYPCSSRFELHQRIKYHEVLMRVEHVEDENVVLKNLYLRRLDVLKRQRKVFEEEPVSFRIDFDV